MRPHEACAWHVTRGTNVGTQTPTATPEGGRLHVPLCTWKQPLVGPTLVWRCKGDQRSSPQQRSRGGEERYNGYFSCFVTRAIIICLPAPLLEGERHTGPQKTMPSIARGPKTRQAARFLPSRGSYERKQTSGNLRSLLMTFTIAPPLRESMQTVGSRAPRSGRDYERADHTTSALPLAWIST